jgi:DNA primase large subunit
VLESWQQDEIAAEKGVNRYDSAEEKKEEIENEREEQDMSKFEFVSEYLVVHELVHLEYSDHSQKFWKIVKQIFLRYEEAERWKNENKSELALSKSDVLSKQ